MNIEKENLLKIYRYSHNMDIYNGIIQIIVSAIFFGLIIFLIFMQQPDNPVAWFILFSISLLEIAIAIQTYRVYKKPAYIVEGKIIEKIKSSRIITDSARETIRKFKIDPIHLYEIRSNLGISLIEKPKYLLYDVHHRLFDLFEQGYEGKFVSTGGNLLFAELSEIETKTPEELDIIIKKKLITFLFFILFLGLVVFSGLFFCKYS